MSEDLMVTIDEVQGRRIDLSDGRAVFFGTSAEHPDNFFFAFRNSSGEDHLMTLTREAKEALVELLTDPTVGLPLASFPYTAKPEWYKWVYTVRALKEQDNG